MSTMDIITLIIALWGAGLATYEVIRSRRKERRTLRLSLFPAYPEESKRFPAGVLMVTNIGFRPVTITYAFVEVFEVDYRKGKNKRWPTKSYHPQPEKRTLPLTLADAETALFPLEPLPVTFVLVIFTVEDADKHKYKLKLDLSSPNALIKTLKSKDLF